MRQQQLEIEVEDLKAQNAALRAEIDNLQAAPTILGVLGPEAFDHMVALYPSFREDNRHTMTSDLASEVIWSCIRMTRRFEERLENATFRSIEASSTYGDLCADYERATKALAEYAMRAVEEAVA